jgi:hypothetical protein
MAAILLGLTHPFVRRLTNSWANVSDRGWLLFDSLEKFSLDCSVRQSSWNLKEVQEEELESKKCIIPFWGIYMMEAKFAAEADSSIRDLVYFDRYRRLAQVTRKMIAFKKNAVSQLPFEKIDHIQQIIRSKKVYPDNAWWNLVKP